MDTQTENQTPQTSTEPVRPWDPQLEALHGDVTRLRQNLEVQVNLAGKEAKDAFGELDRRWQDVAENLRRFEARAEDELVSLREDVVARLQDLRLRYWALRDRLQATKS